MTALQLEQHRARMRTLQTLRVVIDEGCIRFQPVVHVSRDVRPRSVLCWDRIGKK